MSEIRIVGIGPGRSDGMTLEAIRALEEADVIVGYDVYVDLIRPQFPDKIYLTSAMRREVERCRAAVAEAEAGRRVAVVCSGDGGIYGMASLIMQLLEDKTGVEVAVVPGVTAAVSGAALLGSPLTEDFAVVSLSDLLTPWEIIERRLLAAAQGDYVICLYNPGSRTRTDHLRRACNLMLRHKPPETVCGIVRNIGREGESKRLLTLAELRETEVDMLSTVFVGNSRTRVIRGQMVTMRGYQID